MVIILSCAGEELYRLNTSDFIEEISVGRSPDCTWSVGHADSSTSSRHAMISRRKSDFYLTDLGSRNGTYLNERRIKEIKAKESDPEKLHEALVKAGGVNKKLMMVVLIVIAVMMFGGPMISMLFM